MQCTVFMRNIVGDIHYHSYWLFRTETFADEVIFEVCYFGILILQVHMSGVTKTKEEIANLSLTHAFISSVWFKYCTFLR